MSGKLAENVKRIALIWVLLVAIFSMAHQDALARPDDPPAPRPGLAPEVPSYVPDVIIEIEDQTGTISLCIFLDDLSGQVTYFKLSGGIGWQYPLRFLARDESGGLWFVMYALGKDRAVILVTHPDSPASDRVGLFDLSFTFEPPNLKRVKNPRPGA